MVLLGGHDVKELLRVYLYLPVRQLRPLGEGGGVVQLVQLDVEVGQRVDLGQLVLAADIVAHRERLDVGRVLAHAVRGQRAVDAARQEAADLHVGDLMRRHRLVEHAVDLVGPLVQTLRLVDLVRDMVVALDVQLAALEHHEVAGQQLVHVLKHGLRVVHVLEAQVLRQHLAVEFLLERRVRQKRLDLAAVDQAVAVVLVVERLDAEQVARAHEALLRRVPDGDGEHAAQLLEHVGAPRLVAVDDGLGVAVRDELVAQRLKLGAQLLEVVDLAVERDGHRAVGVLHGLARALEVDDAQAAEAHGDVVVHEEALVVGPAMGDAIGHVLDDGLVGIGIVIDRGESHESAHMIGSSCVRACASRAAGAFISFGMIRHRRAIPKGGDGNPISRRSPQPAANESPPRVSRLFTEIRFPRHAESELWDNAVVYRT